jgi:hypothetical protein
MINLIKGDMKQYTEKPTEFVGHWISVNNRIMIWQDFLRASLAGFAVNAVFDILAVVPD